MENNEALSPEAPPKAADTMVNENLADDIVSVNDRGRRRGGKAGPFLMMAGVALVVLTGGFVTLKVIKAQLSGSKPVAAATNPISAGVAHDFNSDARPPLPGKGRGTTSIGNVPGTCPDGTAGHELRGQDGAVVRNASEQTVRVCPNGQVLGVTESQQPSAQPIPVVRSQNYNTDNSAGTSGPSRPAGPFDTPVMLNDGRYGTAPILAALADPQGAMSAVAHEVSSLPPKSEGLLTGPSKDSLEAQLTPSSTPMVQAARLSNLSLLLPKGRTIDCGLSVRIISTLAGQASCVVTQNVYSANGKVVLIERGSEAVGEYRSGVSVGQNRLFVLWNRITTPSGVVINLNSPSADELGSTGTAGKVDNHWFERIGSAFLLSTVQDAVQYEIAQQQAKSGGSTFVLGNTAQAGNQMAERILESTINIPPTIYKNQGDHAVIYVARDLDFSNVYRLRAKQ